MDSSSGSGYRQRDRGSEQFRRHRLLYERRIAIFAVLAALPGVVIATTLIWTHAW